MAENPKVQILLLPGGSLPERMTAGAIGFDVRLRALVSAWEMDPAEPRLRMTTFDFVRMPVPNGDRNIAGSASKEPTEDGTGTELVYRLDPGKTVLGGIGFVTAMQFPMYYWIAPRSGLAAKYHVQVTNAPGTVDPDYRGEAAVSILNGGEEPFKIRRGMRIAQIIFQKAEIPDFEAVSEWGKLSSTDRGAGGFGSTGL